MTPDALTLPAASRPAPARQTRPPGRLFLRAAGVGLLLVAGFCGYFRRPLFEGNLGVVDPGLVLRSAQPTGRLPDWIREYKVRSVLNLRGGSEADWWYAAEVKAVQSAGVAFYDFPMNATRRPSRHELLVLVDFFQACAYPLLIHCKSGADRTGLASALYLMVRRGMPPERAESAFSLEYTHIPLGGPERLHEPLREYGAWLQLRGLVHTPARFREWIKNDYQAPDGAEDPPPLAPGPRHRQSARHG